MQLTSILLLVIQASAVLSAPHDGNTDDAPDLSNSSVPPPGPEWESLSERSNPLIARACVASSPYGCDVRKGRCWKVCAEGGEWCWTAKGDGGGAWNTCTSWRQCDQVQKCGKSCKKGSTECGCNCLAKAK